jgi:hypothetical protein
MELSEGWCESEINVYYFIIHELSYRITTVCIIFQKSRDTIFQLNFKKSLVELGIQDFTFFSW